MPSIEMKIKLINDKIIDWEDLTPAKITLTSITEEAIINEAAKIVDVAKIREIRWNYPASYQGHYVPVNTRFNTRFQRLGDIVDAIETLEGYGHDIFYIPDKPDHFSCQWASGKSQEVSSFDLVKIANEAISHE